VDAVRGQQPWSLVFLAVLTGSVLVNVAAIVAGMFGVSPAPAGG